MIPSPQIIANAFFQTAERTSQMEEPVRDIAQLYSDEIEANFAAEGRPARWKDLAESTIAKRRAEGYDAGPILTRSSELRDVATSIDSWDIASSGQLVVAQLQTPDYGRFHITGWVYGPVRDWTYTSPDIDEAIDGVLTEWLDEAFAPVEALP
jgi:phage gpG-like protein